MLCTKWVLCKFIRTMCELCIRSMYMCQNYKCLSNYMSCIIVKWNWWNNFLWSEMGLKQASDASWPSTVMLCYVWKNRKRSFLKSIFKSILKILFYFVFSKYFLKVFYFVIFKILLKSILFCIFKILLKSILPSTEYIVSVYRHP